MDLNRSHLLRRTLCAVCALTLALALASPAALAAGDATTDNTQATLSRADAAQMAQADAAVEALVNSSAYDAMDLQQRQAAAQEQLDQLASQGLIQADSVRYDQENNLYSFTYDCGVLGGILLTDWEDEELVQLPLTVPEELAFNPLDQTNDVMPLGNAIVYYAFDDTVDSNRYPYYTTMQEYWNGWGLSTTIDNDVTVSDLRHMDDYDLCIISTHGAYYSYTTGWLFKQVHTSPILVLREESSFWDDLRYGFDLLTHRVIKVNGVYCITPSFFESAYRGGQLNGTMIFSEACEFFGTGNVIDLSMSTALLDGGASAVAGFVNNVYAIYSRSMLWGTVNQLIMGKNILQAVDAAAATYGPTISTGICPRAAPRPTATPPLPWCTATTPPPCTPSRNPKRRDPIALFSDLYYTECGRVVPLPHFLSV